ncbi:thioester-containing protein 1 allele R1 [Stomoxys calcitrans]|uniref:thioester-containing protein 1 allele R1 n=1 Tax=Stomoxys calcitrans TaxID=35570 RepID=UPI0027E239A0|nr:thioester-containing protein 1 allele R1 [Stomoxys calcitrans]XP_013104390.2 thioester-containing protein 1 allele R1 [Stomoxys calcitrans]XP_013104391.2 thioester-containing protein 1 allele R1 [Stomoxys calcitrans]
MFVKQRQQCFVILSLLVHLNAGQGLYSIIAPNTLRPNSQYHVAVSIHKSPEPVRVKVGIIGSTYSDFKTAEVRPYSTEMVHFDIPALKSDRYNLTAEGLSGIRFTNETRLNFDAHQFTVMVQTDKAIYKPKDIVHYRVLLMDANLKPVINYGRVHITLRDSGDNVIRSYRDVKLTSGVYANDLELSDYPKLGEWSVEVEVMEETYKRTFEVVEYILPKFVVDIDTDKHVIYKDGKIRATIRAYYDFGKPIVGEATLSIYPTFFGSLQPFVNDLITRKVVPIDGSAYFEFDIRDELKLKEDYEREYLLDALVEETSTSSVQNFSTVITVHLDPYRVEATRLPSNYIPGVPFEVSAKVQRNDGAMMKDFKPDLTAFLTNVYGSSEMYNRTTYTLDGRGEVKMKFTVPVGDKDEYHSVIVDYQGIITDIGKVPRKHLHSKNFITAKVLNEKPMVNQEVSINVRCSEPMRYFVYQIVGRGDILLSRSVDVSDNNFHTFKFLSTFAMMPRAKLLVYLVINGEFVYDEQVIEFEENLLNNVQIEAPLKVPPGQDIDITITSKPYNYIGLMIVDQNAINIRKGSDLSTSSLMRALNEYELNDINTPIASPGKESGVVTMSNTDYIIEKEPETTPALGRAAYNEEEHKLTTIRKTDIGPAHAIEVNTLAPGKGRYAFSYTPKPFWHNPRIHVMHAPADTWLFMNVTASSEGRTKVNRRLPASMTSWVVSAFALDPVQGIGLTNPSKKMQTYKEFYITNELPYSIKLGETIALPFVVFNNKDSDLDVDVTLYNTNQEFDFPQVDAKSQPKPKVELYSRRTVRVLAKSSKSVAFIVTPKRVGSLVVKAVASNQFAGDSIESSLLVEHPGATEIVNKGFLFEMGSSTQRKANVSIRIPRNAIPDSAKIEVSAVGDVVGSIMGNVENLLRVPSGCGEQTMIQFMPNLMVLKYLQRTRQLTTSVETQAKKNLQLGYQTLLYYRHKNGGFSAFGLSEEKSSTWLTAYVAKAFRLASEFIQIDENVIKTALEYVVSQQNGDGGFAERGDVFEQFEDEGLSLSAFATLALMENMNTYPEYNNNLNKALDYITRGLDGSSNLHAMAIGTYVLSKANHNAKVAFLQRLDAMAVNEDGLKWWNKTAPPTEAMSPWYNHTRSVNVEISSYAVLSLLENNLIGDALPVLRWLMNQRNDLGGFVSSQDSVVGLQALIAFAERFSSQANNLQLAFSYGSNAETIINVNAQNSLALQSIELPNNLKNITVSATGNGLALAQVTYRYNTNVTSAWPRFVLDPTVNRNSHSDYLHLSACASFIPAEGDTNRSNLAVMEIYLPSGFVVDTDTLPTLESSDRIKRVETQKRNSVVIIYFDYLDRREVCPTLHAYKVVKVTNHKPVPVIMYDYYDNVRRARQFYRAPKSQICDVCEYANCGALCEKAEKRESRRLDSNDLLEARINSAAADSAPTYCGIIAIMAITYLSLRQLLF